MANIPANCKLELKPFTIKHSDEQLAQFRTLLELSPLSKPTYEGTQPDMGVTSKWMKEAKEQWLDPKRFDWRAVEKKLNTYPQYTTVIPNSGRQHTLHFIAHFSPSPTATPIIFLHGWPGSYVEFFPILHELTTNPAHADKYHIIVPSLPGYCYSSSPPLDAPFGLNEVAALCNDLMIGLGLSGYVAQGGDIGSFVSRMLTRFDECRGCLLNMWVAMPTDDKSGPVAPHEAACAPKREHWEATGRAYSIEHATRPATIGHVLSASPLSLLAWIGEKFLTWTDPSHPPPIDLILEFTTLWWLTETFPSSIYPYRMLHAASDRRTFLQMIRIEKPWGFSWFPHDIMTYPRSWIEATGGCVFFESHGAGGHFPGFEKPGELARDLGGFVDALVKKEGKK